MVSMEAPKAKTSGYFLTTFMTSIGGYEQLYVSNSVFWPPHTDLLSRGFESL